MRMHWMLALAASLLAGSAAGQEVPAPAGTQEKLSYALGMTLGTQLRQQSVEVDVDAYVRGLRDAISGGKTLLSEAEAKGFVVALQNELRTRNAALANARPRRNPGIAEKDGSGDTTRAADGAVTQIKISYKVDPRLTRSIYLGDRWISPPTYSRAAGEKPVTVEARAEAFDASGRSVNTMPTWTVADPEMVKISQSNGNEVRISVLRDGKCTVRVASREASAALTISATSAGGITTVEISRPPSVP